jgi:hypothetical protein
MGTSFVPQDGIELFAVGYQHQARELYKHAEIESYFISVYHAYNTPACHAPTQISGGSLVVAIGNLF